MINKTQRQMAVFQALEKLKRARPEQIITQVAQKFGVEANLGFKKSVHRDLKALVASLMIGFDYYTPSGEMIPPGEENEHPNLRIEYYLLSESGADIDGYQLLKTLEGDILCKSSLAPSLHISEVGRGCPKDSTMLTFELVVGRAVSLWFAQEDKPIKFILSRTFPEMRQQAQRNSYVNQLPNRTAIVFLPDQSISSIKSDGTGGHCEIQFEHAGEGAGVIDRGSRNGTKYSTNAALVRGLMSTLTASNQTAEQPILQPHLKPILGQAIADVPLALVVGQTLVVIHKL